MIKKSCNSGLLLLTIALIISLMACNPARKYEKNESDAINAYLNSNPGYTASSDGLYLWETLAGTGRAPVGTDTVSIFYTGKYTNGSEFDSNVGLDLFKFTMDDPYVIRGLHDGVSLMKEGGKAKLLIPSSLAYGENGYYFIPGYTPLVFEVQLVKVVGGVK